MDSVLTSEMAAARLGVSRSTLYGYIRAGRLDAQRVGRDWIIDRRSVDAFRKQPPGRPWTSDDPRVVRRRIRSPQED